MAGLCRIVLIPDPPSDPEQRPRRRYAMPEPDSATLIVVHRFMPVRRRNDGRLVTILIYRIEHVWRVAHTDYIKEYVVR